MAVRTVFPLLGHLICQMGFSGKECLVFDDDDDDDLEDDDDEVFGFDLEETFFLMLKRLVNLIPRPPRLPPPSACP